MDPLWEMKLYIERSDRWAQQFQLCMLNYHGGKSNWIKEYIGAVNMLPTIPAEKFRYRFVILRTLYNRFMRDILNHVSEYLETKIIGVRCPCKPTHVKGPICLNILGSGNSTDRNDDVTYMEEEAAQNYFLQLCEDVLKIYG